MDLFTAVMGGFGLSAAAGLNAWLPLFIVGLAARFTDLIKLEPPFDILTNTWVLVTLGVLLMIEIFADKIPAVDSINDIIHTFIRPVAGGILFAAYGGAIAEMEPALGFILGLLSAGGVHAAKAAARPVVTATTGGIGNPIVSMTEDFVSGTASVLVLFWPILAGIMMGVFLSLIVFGVVKLRSRLRRRKQAVP